MNKLIKNLLLITALLLGTTGLYAEKPEVIALHFHADHCGSCKVLNPKLENARAELGDIPMLYVKVDHSNKSTTHQAELLVEALGLTEIYHAQKKASGYVLLINADSKTIVGKITKKQSSDQIEKVIEASLSS